jgi:predicted RND superfamily exporter protein
MTTEPFGFGLSIFEEHIMAHAPQALDDMPVIKNLADFNLGSGNWLERLVFNHRVVLVVLCAIMSMVAGYQAWHININASFEKMIPQNHPYIKNYLETKAHLRGLGNALRVVVATRGDTILEPAYLETLRQINDDLFLTPGVDRAWVKSLWTPTVRWNEVTEQGFDGGQVMPATYDGSPKSIEDLKINISRAGIIGNLVGNNFKSSMVFVPLLEKDIKGNPIDYAALSATLEEIRDKYQRQNPSISIHIIGFAKLVGDLIDGLILVMGFFLIAAFIACLVIYFYTHCARSTALVVSCSIIAVIWQLGIVSTLGFELDPYSVLVPFLVFAIGVSHGAQKMNGIMQDIGRGTHRLVAARYTFRRLFLAGATALGADAVGFAVLMVIDIPVIQELALTASIGVAVLLFTNLLLLPAMLSFTGVSPRAAAHSLRAVDAEEGQSFIEAKLSHFWVFLERCTEPTMARRWVIFGAVLGVFGLLMSLHLKIGDLDAGAPELRPNSRYNLDNAYITKNYSLSSDVFAVVVRTPPESCLKYNTLLNADKLAWQLQQLPSVQTTQSLVDAVRQITVGSNEGNLKWMTISRNQNILNYAAQQATTNNPDLFNTECSVMPVIAFLRDHKAETLDEVRKVAEAFAVENSTPDMQFLLAAGSAGIEAATNVVVKKAWLEMLGLVYLAVSILCWITFRSWRAVVVAILPLMITSVLCEALMVFLGMGVKVATLPVIALGVGIGVDYALYLLSVQLAYQRQGKSLAESYRGAIQFTGKMVGLVGVTLAAGVITWVFSPIKFQADMGILLTFMFVWNMLGALTLIPALSYFLLRGQKV